MLLYGFYPYVVYGRKLIRIDTVALIIGWRKAL